MSKGAELENSLTWSDLLIGLSMIVIQVLPDVWEMSRKKGISTGIRMRGLVNHQSSRGACLLVMKKRKVISKGRGCIMCLLPRLVS